MIPQLLGLCAGNAEIDHLRRPQASLEEASIDPWDDLLGRCEFNNNNPVWYYCSIAVLQYAPCTGGHQD